MGLLEKYRLRRLDAKSTTETWMCSWFTKAFVPKLFLVHQILLLVVGHGYLLLVLVMLLATQVVVIIPYTLVALVIWWFLKMWIRTPNHPVY